MKIKVHSSIKNACTSIKATKIYTSIKGNKIYNNSKELIKKVYIQIVTIICYKYFQYKYKSNNNYTVY